MRLRGVAVTLVATVLVASPAHAGQELLFSPPAAWVEPVPATRESAGESALPVRVLLMDRQVRLQPGEQATYVASALKFQSPQGLDAGNISLAWRPETEDLTIHKVVIRRGEEVIDVLASGQTFTTLRREQNLDQAMLDGVLTANLFPEDLQVGDILEISTTLTQRDPVLAGHMEEVTGPLNFPADRVRVRVQWPKGVKMQLARTPDLPDWRRGSEGGFETAALQMDDVQPITPPRDAPLRYSMVRFAQATDFASWADVAALEAPLYRKAAQLPAEGSLRTEVERIRDASADPVARAEAALKLVQNRIRYVALAMGEGGLVPADAAQTWSRRYGDCKGKTALLLAILGELGIEAQPVFVHTGLGDTLGERLPTVSAFDHVLVRARIAGRDYWLDGTRTGDSTLARLPTPDFGWGLPVYTGTSELVRMVPAPLDEPQSDLAIHMDASKGIRIPVQTRLELVMRGDAAIGTNQLLANLVGQQRDAALREFWRRSFDFVEPRDVGLTFDEAAGELRFTLEGDATLKWDGNWYETDNSGVGYNADFTREPGPNSDAPFAVPHPIFTRTRQTIILPPGFSGPKDAQVDETVAGLEYRRQVTMTGNTLVLETTTRSVATEFAAKDAPAFQKRLRELADKRVYLRIPDGYRPTPADLGVVMSAMPDSVSDLVAQGNELLNAGRYDEALVHFVEATERDPENAIAWANRGVTLVWKDALSDAEAALDKAERLAPRSAIAFRARGFMAQKRGDALGAIDAYSKALEVEPDSTFARGRRALAYVSVAKPHEALADAAEVLKREPTYLEMYLARAFSFSSLGQQEDAGAEVDRMLAAMPDDPRALTAARDLYVNFGFPDKARALAERAAAGPTTPMSLLTRARLRDSADTEGQLADLDEALRMSPDFGQALAWRAQLRASKGDVEGALSDARAAIEADPRQRDLYLLQANIARSNGRKDEALAAASALLANNPDDGYSHVAAGKIYAAFGMHDEALAQIDRALAISPEPYIYLNRSDVRDPKDFDSRLADIEEALRRAPNYVAGYTAKGRLLSERGDHSAAVEAYDKALAVEKDSTGLLTMRGIALARQGDRSRSERDFAQARQQAKDAATLNNICYQKAVEGVALERALEECNESLRLVPDHPPTLDSRGYALLRLGRLDDAIQDFDLALRKAPELAPSLFGRAIAWSRKGDAQKAAADEQAALRIDPDIAERMSAYGLAVESGKTS